MIDAFSNRLSSDLEKQLSEDILAAQEKLVVTPLPTHSAYMERVGYIKGLIHAVEMMKTIEALLSAPERKTSEPQPIKTRYED